MPSDTSAGTPSQGGPPQGADGDDLVFAAHDLGRDRPTPPDFPDDDVGFAQAPRLGEIPPPPPPPQVTAPVPAVAPVHDRFVIRDLVDAVPVMPVDALVVGAPRPAPTPAAIVPRSEFRIHSSPATPIAGGGESPLPWTVRDDAASAASSRRGWTARHGGLSQRSTQETVRRLREEAVHVSWRAAWIAVTSADNRLFRERGGA